MRLFTLLCFFHFTGVNNGLTYFSVSSGRIERVDPAVVCLQKWLSVAKPAVWKRFFVEGGWRGICSQSGDVIQLASRRTLQNVFSETSSLVAWVQRSCRQIAVPQGAGKIWRDAAAHRADDAAGVSERRGADCFLGTDPIACVLRDRWLGVKGSGVWKNGEDEGKIFYGDFGRIHLKWRKEALDALKANMARLGRSRGGPSFESWRVKQPPASEPSEDASGHSIIRKLPSVSINQPLNSADFFAPGWMQ